MDNTERQRLVDRYVQILDEGHLDELDPILEAAQRDPELSKMIAAVSRGYAEADGQTLSDEERARVRHQLREAVGHLAQAESVDEHGPNGSTNGDAGDGASTGHTGFGLSSQAEQADLQSPTHGQTFMRLIVSNTNKRPTQVAPYLNATTSFIDDANDYPDVVGPNVVHRLVTTADDELGINPTAGTYAMRHNRPCMTMAASRDEAYDHTPPTFEEILERSGMTEEQKAYWRAVARGEA